MNHLASLNKYLRRYRYRLGLGILFIIGSNIFAVYSPQVVRHAVDMATSQIGYFRFFLDTNLEKDYAAQFGITVLLFAILVVILAVMRGIFLFFMRQTIIVMSRHIEYDQKNEVYRHYQSLHADFFKRTSTGDLMSRATEDVSRVRMYTGPAIMYTINMLVLIVMVIYTMLTVDPFLTLFTVFPLPVLGLTIFFVNSST